MKKRLLSLFMTGMITAVAVGCGTTSDSEGVVETVEAPEATAETSAADEEPAAAEESTAENAAEATAETTEAQAEAGAALPAYVYPGPEAFYLVMHKYIVEELGKDYPDADVTIPCPVIVFEDDSDNLEIDVYGDFWVFNYNLEGETLMCEAGGSYPGKMHFSGNDNNADFYEVTSFEVVPDGEDSEEKAKEIFGDHYEEYLKMCSDTTERERVRAQIISNYVAANELNITAYQDYGWDPVELPEENIDNFYSPLLK